jgi:hypothetical protein
MKASRAQFFIDRVHIGGTEINTRILVYAYDCAPRCVQDRAAQGARHRIRRRCSASLRSHRAGEGTSETYRQHRDWGTSRRLQTRACHDKTLRMPACRRPVAADIPHGRRPPFPASSNSVAHSFEEHAQNGPPCAAAQARVPLLSGGATSALCAPNGPESRSQPYRLMDVGAFRFSISKQQRPPFGRQPCRRVTTVLSRHFVGRANA